MENAPTSQSGSRLGTTSFGRGDTGASDGAIWKSTSTGFSNEEAEDGYVIAFVKHLCLCMVVVGSLSFLSIFLWSTMFWGDTCLRFLMLHEDYIMYTGMASAVIFMYLYLMDFFMPSHITGRYCVFHAQDRYLGKFCLLLLFLSTYASCLLSASSFPSIPILVGTFLIPAALTLLRSSTAKKQKSLSKDNLSSQNADMRERMRLLKMLTGREKDTFCFYSATLVALLLSAAICLVSWCVWIELDKESTAALSQQGLPPEEVDLLYIMWSAPLVVAMSDFLFGCLVFLRVYLSRTYQATDEFKSELAMENENEMALHRDLMEHRMILLDEKIQQQTRESEKAMQDETAQKALEAKRQLKRQQYVKQHNQYMQQLTNVVKVIGCILLFMLGMLFVMLQVVAVNAQIALMAQSWLGGIFIAFVSFIAVSFRRLWRAMRAWLKDLPLWRFAVAVVQSDWLRAGALSLLLPFVPVVLALSVLNQMVRKLRGLPLTSSSVSNLSLQSLPTMQTSNCLDGEKSTSNPGPVPSLLDAPADGYLTQRVHRQLLRLDAWNWIGILLRAYVLCIGTLLMTVTPRFLNILLSFMTKVLSGTDFGVICVSVFIVGLLCFLLPPVPGAPVYFFAGILLTEKSPWGFMPGALCAILLSFLLKLVACAMQQKVIGERLSHIQWVRVNVGAHRPLMRTIEAVLRRPGFSLGKVMILCGGPDWPTSVLAGILRLSLLQMELGTTPIIFYVTPFTLAGSFYIRKHEGEFWDRTSNLMVTATLLVTAVLYVGMAWTIQEEFEKNTHDLTRPLEKFVDLDWRDYCQTRIHQRCNVKWKEVPPYVKNAYMGGAALIIMVSHAFWWGFDACFGQFTATDFIDDLVWFGEPHGFFKLPGICCIVAACISCVGLRIYIGWHRSSTHETVVEVTKELEEEEQSWKSQRVEEARRAASRQKPRSSVASDTGSTERTDTNSKEKPMTGDPEQQKGMEGPLANGCVQDAGDNAGDELVPDVPPAHPSSQPHEAEFILRRNDASLWDIADEAPRASPRRLPLRQLSSASSMETAA